MDDDELYSPDRAVEGDPAVDALSFVEVLGEEHQQLRVRIDAARKMMRPYALRALVDGAEPKEVARACGFPVDDDQQQHPSTLEEALEQNFLMGMGMWGRQRQPSGMERFCGWLQEWIHDTVHDA